LNFVSIIMANKYHYEIMKNCADTLEQFGVKYELIISSAVRSPKRTKEYITKAETKGSKVFICAAGMGAQLAGFVSSNTTKPVIGVPLKGDVAMQILAATDKELAIKLKEDRVVKEKKICNDSKEIEVIL